MKKFIFGLLVLFMFVFVTSGALAESKLEGYLWSEPNSHFKVTIPNDFEFKEELPFSKGNPKIKVYMFIKEDSGEFLLLWWEHKSVHNLRTLDERVNWNIDFFIKNGSGKKPIMRPFPYKKGKYWIQKNSNNIVLFFLRKDPKGNFVGYEYYKPLSMGSMDNIPTMLRYLSSFEF